MLHGMAEQRKVALVTGGARRVGRAIVEKFAAAGYDIVFTYNRSESEARDLERAIEGMGRTVMPIKVDVKWAADAVHTIWRPVDEQFGGYLDVLVNNASIYRRASINDVRFLQELKDAVELHVAFPAELIRQFAPSLRQTRGHVINMIDLLAERPWPEYLPYCASKAALANLTVGLARELAPEVTVNGIAPGVVDWPDDYPQAEREKYLKRVPLGRAGTPQDVANLVHFLCTEGSYITGQIIRLDGGRSIT